MTGAAAASVLVSMLSGAFSPAQLDVMTGDNVAWTNTSTKTHNISFETEGFNSGRVEPRGGTHHVIGVYPLVLEGPTNRVRRGTSIAFHVRAPEGAGEVRIEADTGSGFSPVAVAGPGAGGGHEGHEEPGMLHANVVAAETAVYRAAFSGGTSNELRIEVTDAPDIKAALKRKRHARVVNVKATPSTPGARVVLQLNLRERFGWWPVARVPARVVLVGPDWATVLSESRVLKLPRR